MLIERKAFAAVTPIPAQGKPANCLDCPDCQGTCWEAVALRITPASVLHPREVRG